MHDALGHTRRTGRIHDVQRVIKFDRIEFQFSTGDPEILPVDERISRRRRVVVVEGNVDGGFVTWNRCLNVPDDWQAIDTLAVVVIAVGRHQYFRFDLAESIDDTVDSKIRRT